MSMKIGFIGVGNLGEHLVANLLRADFPVTVHDLHKATAAGLIDAGATWARSFGHRDFRRCWRNKTPTGKSSGNFRISQKRVDCRRRPANRD